MNVGDYIRTDIGEIRKVVRVTDDLYVLDKDIVFAHKDKIKKSSPNIIDLIEKNDLVVDNYGNVYVVDNVFDNYIYTTTKQGNIIKTLCDYQIKSIVTKECFESMEYKVKE